MQDSDAASVNKSKLKSNLHDHVLKKKQLLQKWGKLLLYKTMKALDHQTMRKTKEVPV